MRAIKKGATDQSVVIRIMDSTDGTPETGVDYNTTGIDLWYRREGATKTSITEATLAALDSAHSDGGIEHIGDGYYRLDLPDAAVATGANGVMIGGAVTGMIVIGCYVHLVDYDPQNDVRLGLTALPNAAADAAGGLPISDAGGLDLDAKLANTNEITAARMGALTDWINGGRLDLILDIIAADTTTDIPALIDALPTAAEIKTAIEAAGSHLALILADTGTDGVPLTAGAVDAILDEVVEGTLTLRQILRLFLATLAGKSAGGGTATVTFRDNGDTKNRISATVDASGNRTAVTLDGA